MTTADDLRAVVYTALAVPGQLGLHQHTVTLVESVWVAEDEWVDQETPIVHADNRNPHVRFLTLKERDAAGLQDLSIEVGPITPEHTGGGYSAAQLNPQINGQQSFHYLVTGPGMEDGGSKFALMELRVDRALGYRMVLQRSNDGDLARPPEY